jgi:VCBS repeat-containing protein
VFPLPLLPPPLPPNSDPVITAAVADAGTTEDSSPPAASGAIEFTDVDLGDAHIVSIVPGAPGYLGTFVADLTSDSTGGDIGRVTWTFASTAVALQFLAESQQLIQTYTVTIADGHGGFASQLITIRIEGANDVAVISGIAGGPVTEAGGVANGTPGVPAATGDLDAADVDNPSDAWTAVGSPTVSVNGSRRSTPVTL